jgi:O-antigen ligase
LSTRARRSHRAAAPRASQLEERILEGALGLVLAIGALVFWRGADDTFSMPRAVLLILVGVFLLGWWIVRAARGELDLHRPPPAVWAAAAVVVLMVIATFTAGSTGLALWGPYQRDNGLFLYLACAVFFLTALTLGAPSWRRLTLVFSCLGLVVAAYGVLQWLGADPFSWETADLSQVFGTFGQTNFAAGWLAIAIPIHCAVAADGSRATAARAVAGAATVLSVVFLLAAGSFQGVVAVVVGVLPLAFVLWRQVVGPVRRWVNVALAVVALLVVIGAIVPRARHEVTDSVRAGLDERVLLWQASGSIVKDAPVTGAGMSSYAAEFPSHRPAAHARQFAYLTSDEAHDVPLEMAVDGGLLLFVAYVAFVLLVGVAGVHGLLRTPSWLLAGVLGGWLAYVAQSLVSIDVPSLASLHWLLAGAVVALAATDAPFLRPAARSQATNAWTAPAIGLVLVVVSSVWLTNPLRADAAAHRSRDLLATGDASAAVEQARQATNRSPWVGAYWAGLANASQQAGDVDGALEAGRRAIASAPGAIAYRTALARLTAATGDTETARRILDRAMALDPHNDTLRDDAVSILQPGP